jgi:hypothetical protein
MFFRLLDLITEHPGLAVYAALALSVTVSTFVLTRGNPSRW